MEKISIELTREQIEKGLNQAVKEVMESSYRNPFKDIVEEEIKKLDGTFRTMFSSLLADILTSPELKQKLSDLTLQNLVSRLIQK